MNIALLLHQTAITLRWLHHACQEGEQRPVFGTDTAIITHAADLRGGPQDACRPYCPGLHGRIHHHYLVNLGRGFLGRLEQFGRSDDRQAVRAYEFTVGNSRIETPTLWRIGKDGLPVSIYLPPKLGTPESASRLNAGQHRLLQAIIRETTRRARGRRTGPSRVEVYSNHYVPDASGNGRIPCPMLLGVESYVAFGGNKKRKACGYRLMTPGGWLAKAGYDPGQASDFLTDLAGLADRLGLIVVGLRPTSNQWFNLDQMLTMARSVVRRRFLDLLHVRIYGPADYTERWNELFGWLDRPPELESAQSEVGLELATQLVKHDISQRALANGIGMDPSLVSKMLLGKRRCSPRFLQDARDWLAGQGCEVEGTGGEQPGQ